MTQLALKMEDVCYISRSRKNVYNLISYAEERSFYDAVANSRNVSVLCFP